MTATAPSRHTVMMLGTFGLRPKATLRSRALAIAQSLSSEWSFRLTTTPWDHPADRGRRWSEAGIPVVNTRQSHPWLFPFSTVEMVRETRASGATLVHLFKPKGFGDVAARHLSRSRPVVVDMDDWEGDGGWNETGKYGRFQRRLFDWQERTWPRKAAAITVASRALEHRALQLGAASDAIFYVPNGLTRERYDDLSSRQPDRHRERARLNLGDRPTVLLYTRFVEFDPSLIVQVMERILVDVPAAVLLIVGASADGEAEQSIRSWANGRDESTVVKFAGWSSPEKIPGLLATADVALHPFSDNLLNRSKCSVKLLELMAAGLPIVTNDVGENAHMIENERSGLCVPADDISAAASALIRLLSHPDQAASISESARQRVASHFLWEKLACRVADAYRLAVDRDRSNKRG